MTAAKNEISSVVHNTLQSTVEFNQVLSVAYMEGMGMNYHSDGEDGLNDTVASLSLGSPAKMSFRLRNRPGKRAFEDSKVAQVDYSYWFNHACKKTKPRPNEESSGSVPTEVLCPTLLTLDMRHVSFIRHLIHMGSQGCHRVMYSS